MTGRREPLSRSLARRGMRRFLYLSVSAGRARSRSLSAAIGQSPPVAGARAFSIWLMSLHRMSLAIWRARLGTATAEVKRVAGGITKRPAAHAPVDRTHGDKSSVVKFERLFLHRCLDLRVRRIRWPPSCSRTRPEYAGRTVATGQPQAMDLADNGIAGDVAQGECDLAGGEPGPPKGFQFFDTIIGPLSHG